MRNILSIEYEYTRKSSNRFAEQVKLTISGVYVNCLALQAVVERWTAINNEPSNKSSASGSLRVLMELYRVNEKYIQEVVDASRRILLIVLEGLVPGDHLKHCP
ncbi:hypothetical protein O181_077578, partial [Austropuccinia psidii MF-1]|nr:hypothetical protein [Austropuccinia psidii MF-1]